MLTIAPPPAVYHHLRREKRVSRNGATTLNRKACSIARSLVRNVGCGGHPPALFTRMSMRPKRSSVASTRCSSCARSVTSVTTACPAVRPTRPRRRCARGRSPCAPHTRRRRPLQPTPGGAGADALARAGDERDAIGHREAVENHGFGSCLRNGRTATGTRTRPAVRCGQATGSHAARTASDPTRSPARAPGAWSRGNGRGTRRPRSRTLRTRGRAGSRT